jgi:penicillin-binding protein 1A
VIPIYQAMQESRNIPAVKIAMAVGLDTVRNIAHGFGVSGDLAAGPALALGASEATLLQMTGAYAGILNGGSAVAPYGLRDLSLKGDATPLIGQTGGMGARVISDTAAKELTWMMTQVVQNGTGQRAQLGERPVAGKTGTTSEARDAWFIGFTADYVTGVWMGYDNNTPLAGVTGGGIPAEIWHEVMVRVEDGLPITPLPVIVPEPRQPPTPGTDPTPVPPVDGEQSAPDPFTAVLQQLLGNGN